MLRFIALLLALAGVSPLPVTSSDNLELRPLLTFDDAERVGAWRPVHDGVMGGVSSGRVSATGEAARFEGRVLLENNGGFASFRLDGDFPDLTAQDGLSLRVRGDGQVYKLSLRTDGRWDGVSWQAPFATSAGAWTTVHVPFSELTPSWRGRLVPDAPRFGAANLREVGLVIADEQVGPFALEVAAIDAWRAADSRRPGTRAAHRERTAALAARVDGGVGAAALADALRDSERVLVVADPGQLGPGASIQTGRLMADGAALAERDLRIVQLMGARGGRIAGRTLTSDQVTALRERWELPARTWSLAIVGKDGSVKARWSEPVTPEEVFARIDAMPMRVAEAKRRRVN